MIERVIIEWSNKCNICRVMVPRIIKILKKYDIPYVTRNIGDKYYSTYEFHLYQPTTYTISQNFNNIKNPALKRLIESKDISLYKEFDAFVQGVMATPRIYIFLKNGLIVVINGAIPSEKWLKAFEEVIDFLQNIEYTVIL